MRGITAHANTSAEGPSAMSASEWREWCANVRLAAEELRKLAGRAEGAVLASELSAKAASVTGSVQSHRADTFFAMMLGPFAVLETARRQLRP